MASSARLDELKKKFDENPRRYFAPLANEHRKSGNLDQAIALCRTHLPQQPGHISGHIVLAQALFETGSLDESREIFHTALGLDPENLIALRYLGDIAKESADIETARQWYQRVLEVDPRNEEIVELVRDLDTPGPAAAQPSEPAAVVEPVAAPAPSASSYAPPPAPSTATADARFAPLSLDDLDVGDAPSATAPPNDLSQPTAAASADWNGTHQGGEPSLLDAADIDPFDLDPAGSVESLLDANASSTTEDFFLTELSGANAPIDGANQESAPTPEASESRAPHASAAPEETAYSSAADGSFDQDSFYLEPPPPEPVSASAESDVTASDSRAEPSTQPASNLEQVSMPGLDAFVAEYSVTDAELHASAASADRPDAKAAPNADALARFADQETAEWQSSAPEPIAPASQAPDDGLGLEVMEFVPPSREPSPVSAQMPTSDADPILGRTLDSMTSEPGATPAAFVTETMAELYLQQGFRNEALAVYRELLARNPSDASLRDRIEQIETGSLSSIGMAAVSENVVESALKRQSARPARSVRSFFASLASRRVGGFARHAAEYSVAAEPEAAPEGSSPDQADDESGAETSFDSHAEPSADASGDDSQITPILSAAETLATFDPFADSVDPAPMPVQAAPEMPNALPSPPSSDAADQIDAPDLSIWSAPTAEMPAPQPAPSEPSSSGAEQRRALEDLFPDTAVTARTDATAQTLATAFGRSEPQGRPTRAASNELSLDHVFRGTPESAPPADGGFSFDQFFSDSRSPGGDSVAPAAAAQETGRTNGSGDAHDIEQFTAWLEGLKKK